MGDLLLPVIGKLQSKLIFIKINKCALVVAVSQEVNPVLINNLGRRRRPWLQCFDMLIVNLVEMIFIGTKKIGRTHILSIVIIQMQLLVDDSVIDVVCLEQVLERTGGAVLVCLDVVDRQGFQRDSRGRGSLRS